MQILQESICLRVVFNKVADHQNCNFIKKKTSKMMFFFDFCKKFKNIFWENLYRWLLFGFICKFWDVFQNTSFIEHLWETSYLMLQPANTVKIYFTGAFQTLQTFCTRTRSSHSKAFIHVKSIFVKKLIHNEVARCQPASLW